ncbi:hypothetical protein JCM8097_003783 [Rhodosporidiobolus ruineniae]
MALNTLPRAAAAPPAPSQLEEDAQLEELAQVGETKQGGASVQDESSSTTRGQGLSKHERSGGDEGVQGDQIALEDQKPGVDNEKNDSDLDSLSSANDSIAGDDASRSRRTVLYPEGEDKAFSSYTSFVAHCKSRLLRHYGWTAHTGHRYPDYVVARCCRYRPDKCKFAVRAEKQPDGRWKVNRDKCRWEHSHGPGDGEDESSPEDMSVEEEPEVSAPQPDDDVADEDDPTSESGEDLGDDALTKLAAASARPAAWNASTRSPVMLQLVDNRDAIFSQQRTFFNDSRQGRCQKLVQDYFSTLSSANTVPRGSFAQYETFCADNDIPPFPISPSLVALALFAKCSVKNGHYSTYKGDLLRFGRSTESVWADDPEYERLAERSGVDDAIEDFLQERKGVRLRAFNAGKKRNRQAGSSSESAYSSDSGAAKRFPPARAASTSAYSDSGSSEEDDSDGESDGDVDGSAAPSQMVIPNLPSPNDTFSSLTELYLAYATALIPATGISVQILHQSPTTATVKCNRFKSCKGSTPCPYQLIAQLDHEAQRWQIDPAASTLRHAHGPAKEILRDPSWRPRIRNPDLRRALGLASIDKPEPRKKNEKASRNRNLSKPKKQVVTFSSSPRAEGSTSSTRDFTPGTIALPPPPSAGYPFPPTFAPFSSLAHLQQYQSPSHAYSPSTAYFQPPQPACPPQPAYPAQPKPAYSPPLPALSFPSTYLSSSTSSAPLSPTHLAAFLASLHPSLTRLAPNLAAFGISTLDSLATLALLEPESIDALFEQMKASSEHEQTRPPGGVRVSLIQGKLLVKGLREAAAAVSGSRSGSR